MHILYLNAFSAVLCPKTDAATVDATAPMACFEPFNKKLKSATIVDERWINSDYAITQFIILHFMLFFPFVKKPREQLTDVIFSITFYSTRG